MTDSFLAGRRLVFLGTPEPAARILRRLLEEGFDVCHVVTGRDAKRGRGGALSPSPVKVVALGHGVPVVHDLDHLPADNGTMLGVVVAYGRMIPAPILARIPMVNVHFSLLPRWRGAAPVERAILAGDATTGVCIMEVVDELDAGGVFARREIPVGDSTASALMHSLTALGADLLVDVLGGPAIVPVPQSGTPTYAKKITASEGVIDWNAPVRDIVRQVRALRCHTTVSGRRLLVLSVEPAGERRGTTTGACDDEAVVDCGDGAVRLVEVQPEGRGVVDALQWRRGVRGPVQFGTT